MDKEPQLNVNPALVDVQTMYDSDEYRNHFSCLLLGKYGTGKTTMLETCRKPVLIHSFDPGGLTSIRDTLEDPEAMIYGDTRFQEREDSENPHLIKKWEAELKRLEKAKVFDTLGTFVIDSFTTWCMAIMAAVQKGRGKAGEPPELRDYMLCAHAIKRYMLEFTALPCDFVMTGHLELEKDEVTGASETVIATYPSLRKLIPTLFDEIYVMETKNTSKGTQYNILTQNTGYYKARTRLGARGRFELREEPNFQKLLKKAGYSVAPRPYKEGGDEDKSDQTKTTTEE